MKSQKVITVRLDEETYRTLSEFVKKEKITKSAVLKKALDSFLKLGTGFENLPEVSERINVLEQKLKDMEKRSYELINRVNIVSRQLENLQGRR